MSASPAPFQEPWIAASVSKLLRLRLIILINGFRRAKTRTKIVYIVAGLGILAFLWFVLSVSTALLGFLRSPELARYIGNTTPLLEGFPIMIVSISASGILLTSFGVLLQVLYLSGDMDFLMSAPVPIRAVFIAKLVQAVLPNFGILCLLALPVLFGLGISSGYNFLYYPFAVIVLAAIAILAASLASLLVLIVARCFPPRRVAEVLGFVVGLTVFTLSQSARFMNFGSNPSDRHMTSFVNMIGRFNRPWSPMAWAGRGLVELGKSHWPPASGLLAASLILSGVIFYAALATSERLYYTGWANLRNNRRKSKNKTRANAAIPGASPITAAASARLLPASVSALLAKDLLLCRRDLRNLSRLLTPMILGIVYAVNLLRSHGQMPPGRGHAPPAFIHAGNAVLAYGDIALALFLGWMLAARLAGFGFSQEGKNYWILKAAPISTRQLLTAKFLFGYIPSALIPSLYVLVLGLLKRASLWSILVNLISVCMMVAGMAGIYLAFGTRGAKFDWENPSQMNRAVGCLGMLVGMLYLPVCIALFIGPVFLAPLLRLPAAAGQLAGLLLGGAASALAVIIPLGLAEKRVATLAED
jgi:hypothetical protein